MFWFFYFIVCTLLLIIFLFISISNQISIYASLVFIITVFLLLRGILCTWNRRNRNRSSFQNTTSRMHRSRRIGVHWTSPHSSRRSENLVNNEEHIQIEITDTPPHYDDLTPPPSYADINNLTHDYNNPSFIKTTPI